MSKNNDNMDLDGDDVKNKDNIDDEDFIDTSASEASENDNDEWVDEEEEEVGDDVEVINEEDEEIINEKNEEEDDDDDEMEEDNKETASDDKDESKTRRVYLPTMPLDKGENLVCDPSAYVMLHEAQTGAPCLSFDIIKDELGNDRTTYPQIMYAVGGTQSKKFNFNRLIVMKMSNLTSNEEDNERELEDNESDDDESGEESKRNDPVMNSFFIKHRGCINRIKTCQYGSTTLASVWAEVGKVSIWDLKQPLQAIDDPFQLAEHNKKRGKGPGVHIPPIFSFTGHLMEGFAMDWSTPEPGVLATGDCKKNIHIWHPQDGGTWKVDQKPLIGHTNSVEDLQWSPNEKHVLASCSVDKTVRIWDTRVINTKSCMLTVPNAHTSDVNVISWNRMEPLIVSGGDDGCIHVWDLRRLKEGTSIATFKHHTAPVTTVEWHPSESSTFASGGADDQIALWDLAVERDDATDKEENDVKDLPSQLLFIHLGQKDIKELHWHPQIPGALISTANSGFNIFRTISV